MHGAGCERREREASIEKMGETVKKNEQTMLPLPETAAKESAPAASPGSRPLGTHVHRLADGAVVPRCCRFDYDDGDEYAEPVRPADRVAAFAADLVAHGAVLSGRPGVTKTTRRTH